MIDEMIAEYSGLPADDNRKCDIIEALSVEADRRVLPFLLKIVGNKHEYDLARVEALRGLPIAYFVDEHEVSRAAQVIADIINDQSDETFVRQWAAKAVYRFTQSDLILTAICSRVLDPHENIDIQFNLLTGLAAYERTPGKLRVLREIASSTGDSLGNSASRLMAEWGGETESTRDN